MAGSEGKTSGIQVRLYSLATFTYSGTLDWSKLSGSGKLIEGTNEVPDVLDIGDQEQNANTIEYTVYGQQSSRRIAGITSIGEFTFAVAHDNSITAHTTLRGLAIGSKMRIAIETRTAADKITADYIQGTLAGRVKSTPIDAPAQIAYTIAMDQDPITVDQSS